MAASASTWRQQANSEKKAASENGENKAA